MTEEECKEHIWNDNTTRIYCTVCKLEIFEIGIQEGKKQLQQKVEDKHLRYCKDCDCKQFPKEIRCKEWQELKKVFE